VTYESRYPTTYLNLTDLPQRLNETVLSFKKSKTWNCYEDGSPDRSVSTVTRLRGTCMCNPGRLPAGVTRIFFLTKIQTISVARQAYKIGTLPPVQNSRSMKLTIHLHPAPRLRICETPTVSCSWRGPSLMRSDNFIFTLYTNCIDKHIVCGQVANISSSDVQKVKRCGSQGPPKSVFRQAKLMYT